MNLENHPEQTITQTTIELIKDQALQSPSRLAASLGFENAPHHQDWYEALANETLRKMVIFAPRGHAKSTVFSVIYPLWEILRNPNVRILIVSNTSSQAKAFLRQISSTIENHQRFNTIFGNLKPQIPEKWADTEIIVTRDLNKFKGIEEKDPTVNAVGAGGAILSKRADIIVCDDLLNKDNTRTPEQRQKLKEWFDDTLVPVLNPDGRLIVIGTAFNTDDLLHDLYKDPTYDYKRKYKAIIQEPKNKKYWDTYKEILHTDPESDIYKKKADEYYFENEKIMLEGAKVLWPERMGIKKLIDIRISSGTRSFGLMYQNDASSSGKGIFKETWVDNCADRDRKLLNQLQTFKETYIFTAKAQGVDLASSEAEGSNSNVIITLAKTNSSKYLILNALYDSAETRWSPKTLRENIKLEHSRFNSDIILVESNAFQSTVKREIAGESTIPIKAFTTTGEKFDETVGVNSMAVLFENEQFIIPAKPDDSRTIEFYKELKAQLLAYPTGHTGDLVMALWIALVGIRSLTSKGVRVKTRGKLRKSVKL